MRSILKGIEHYKGFKPKKYMLGGMQTNDQSLSKNTFQKMKFAPKNYKNILINSLGI